MKSLSVMWKSLTAMLMFTFVQAMCLGQDNPGSGSSTTVKTTTSEHTEWYTAPWVWIVGGAIVILLLVAILSGGRSSSSRTTITDVGGGTTSRTVTTDTDEV
ncbi:MAG: hypothetical protein E6H06_04605 [Bacteroidetes bacterium]|nr:MAG: hypothetical protein E6H06_04605 [Bacteroidota bacterium]